MDVQVETPGGLVRQLRVRIPAERVTSAVDERLQRLARRVRIPGFRPGKAPLNVVQKQFGQQARLEVVADLVRDTYPEALDKAGVNPASAAHFEVTTERPGEPLEYVARFEIYPEIRLAPLTDLRYDRPVVAVTDADADKVIATLRRNRRELVAATRAAQEGDVCTVDFEGAIDDAPFDGNKGEAVRIEIGHSDFLPDMERGLVGHATGEEFEVDVRFPDDYRREDLRGKVAKFRVRMKEVHEPKLPEINADFLKEHGVDGNAGLDGLRAKVKTALEAERDKAIKARIKQQVLEQLLASNPVEVPQALIAREVERLRDETAQRLRGGKLKPDQKQRLLPDGMFEDSARRRVALGLLVGAVVKARDVGVDDARVARALDDIATDFEHPEQVKQYYRGKPELMQSVRAMVLEEQVVETLLADASATEREMTLDELMNPKHKQ